VRRLNPRGVKLIKIVLREPLNSSTRYPHSSALRLALITPSSPALHDPEAGRQRSDGSSTLIGQPAGRLDGNIGVGDPTNLGAYSFVVLRAPERSLRGRLEAGAG
jgi:hypothetical protein